MGHPAFGVARGAARVWLSVGALWPGRRAQVRLEARRGYSRWAVPDWAACAWRGWGERDLFEESGCERKRFWRIADGEV